MDVLTAQEDSTNELPDAQLLDRATELGRVLVSQDQDFLTEASDRQHMSKHFTGVIYAPQNPGALGQYIQDLELIALADVPERYADRVEYLPLQA